MPKPLAAFPKLVNRGPAGLLTKVPHKDGQPKEGPVLQKVYPKDRIAPALKGLIVPIDSLVFDPVNARLHPERNLEAIKHSLNLYGQVKPVVVRKATMHIVAGNGTMEAARALGWTKLAASIVDMTEVEAAGYGLADNRTAELAKWDFEVVAQLDKLLQAAGEDPVGWSQDELEVLRCADWTPPTITDGEDGFGSSGTEEKNPLVVGFTPDQYEIVGKAVSILQEQDGELDQAGALLTICRHWLTSLSAQGV